jgi:NADH dehydrogenase FAD-containing subunit
VLSDGRELSYDLLSFDIGAQAKRPPATSDSVPIIGLKPIERAIDAIETSITSHASLRIVIVGAGAGGSEVAMALAARLRRAPRATVTVCDEAARPVLERGTRTSALVERAFAAAGIDFFGSAAVEQITHAGVRLQDEGEVPADLVVWATGAGAPPLFKESGLPVDERGFLLVSAELRSTSLPAIFAAGDCATISTHPQLAKAGVYAVREAPVLWSSLKAAVLGGVGGEPPRYRPQPDFLSLLNTADGRAFLRWKGIAAHSRWAWRLKDRIDRRFMARYQSLI